MLEVGGNALARDTVESHTPLHMAAGAGHSEIVKLLVKEVGSCGLAVQSANGDTPLHHAAFDGHVETVKLLLELGANLHAQAKDGNTPLHCAVVHGHVETVTLLLESGARVRAQDNDGSTLLHDAAAFGHVETVKLLLESGANLHAQTIDGATPLHYAAHQGQLDTVKLLVDMGSDILSRTANGITPLHDAESEGHEAVVSFLRKNVSNKRRPKAATGPVVDPAAQAAAEVAAAAMAALLIAEEEEWEAHKQAPPSKQGSSTKARKRRNRRKANSDELDTGSQRHDEAISGSVASSSGRRDQAGERDDMGRDAARHSKVDREIDTHRGEENVDPVFNKDDENHNEPEGSISRDVQLVEASIVEREAGASHSGVEQPPTTTQAERQQQKERERKGKQKQRKRETMIATLEETRATLEEALARVDTTEASLNTLNALDAAIASAKPVVSSCARSDLLRELLRQAEEKSLNLLREVRAVAKAAENGSTCVVCLEAPKDTVVLPCKHLVMCAECTRAVLASSSQPQCPVCRSRIADCMYGVFF
jgi:hypothetical protein